MRSDLIGASLTDDRAVFTHLEAPYQPFSSARALILAPTTMVLVVLMAATLGACSDLYFDRRESLTLHAGDSVASNIAVQTVDPWPRAAANRHIDGDGVRTQKAVERYRTNKVIPPQGMGTSSVQYAPAAAAQAASGPPSP